MGFVPALIVGAVVCVRGYQCVCVGVCHLESCLLIRQLLTSYGVD